MIRAVFLGVVLGATQPALAQTYVPTSLAAEPGLPRTPDGHPDLQGLVWEADYLVDLEGDGKTPLVLSEAEARKFVDDFAKMILSATDDETKLDPELAGIINDTDGLPVVRGQRRSRMLVDPADGKLPLTQAAKDAMAAKPTPDEKLRDNPEDRSIRERCLALDNQPPGALLAEFYRFEVVQTPGQVLIHYENGDETRVVPFASRHGAKLTPDWMGDSVARWDGDTLVIETTHMRVKSKVRAIPSFIVADTSTVIEKFTRLSQDELLYQFTVIDPAYYTAPWLGEYALHRAKHPMFPSPCHEGNYSMPNILRGQRVMDERGKR